MKTYVLLLTILLSGKLFAGGFLFPNVSYSYAKLHYFNIDLAAPHLNQPSIYRDGVYAETKVGNGMIVPESLHRNLQDIFKHGVDELVYGLSKCYLPHHGIIYYNERHEPVASLSICFACDKIKIWSKTPLQFHENTAQFDYKKAEKQMADLEKLLKKNDVFIYTHPDEWGRYAAHFDTLANLETADTLILDAKTDQIDHVSFLHAPITLETHPRLMPSKWAPKLEMEKTREQHQELRTYRYRDMYQLQYKVNADGFGKLITLEAHGPHLFLPGGLRVGMSFEEVVRLLKVSGKVEPCQAIHIASKNYELQLGFHWQTLQMIKIKSR